MKDVEKEQDDGGKIEENVKMRPRTEKLVIAAHTLYNFKKKHLKTMLQLWNRSNLKELEDPKMKVIERRKKEGRLIIKDVKDDGSDERRKQKNENKKSNDLSSSRKGKEKIYEPEQIYDPLLLIRFMTLGFSVYIDHTAEMAMERQRGALKWISHLEEGSDLLDSMIQKMKLMNDEMRRMRKRKDLKEEYVRFHKMLSELDEINEHLDGSPNIGIVSERDCTELELRMCERELKRCKNDVDVLQSEVLRLMKKSKGRYYV